MEVPLQDAAIIITDDMKTTGKLFSIAVSCRNCLISIDDPVVPSAPSLLKKDKTILEQGKWLNDRIINGAQKLLKRQFPLIDGLHSTISIAANQADVLRGGAIQILHVDGNHWICIKIGEDKSEVKIFDSLYSTIKISLVDQLMKLLHSNKDEITFHSMHIQRQAGVADCGLYAIAVATSLCYDEDPTLLNGHKVR